MNAIFAIRFGAVLLAALPLALSLPADAQPSTGVTIKWEVKNRFRLFKNEDDFKHMVQFHGRNGVLADETALAGDTKGVGWASQVVVRLCVNTSGKLQDPCPRQYSGTNASDRASFNETYVVPDYHRIGVTAQGAPAGALCSWKFVTEGSASSPGITRDQPCSNEVLTRVPYGKMTHVQLFVATQPENSQPTVTTDVKVRDILIAGLGDSTAAGEGDPDRAIPLDPSGFCFRRVGSADNGSYFRPSRAGYHGDAACDSEGVDDALNWSKIRALWMDRACHRSLYSYQIRVALALAIENPQIAVTYIPLGCSGATIPAGMLDHQEARESDCVSGVSLRTCSQFVPGQMDTLQQILNVARQQGNNRNLDLALLTVGANDIGFAKLVANVIIDHSTEEYRVFSRVHRVSTVDDAATALQGLPGAFVNLRARLKPLLGNKLERVIYVSYGHPALYNNGEPCPESRQGFDVHPAFTVDGSLLKSTSDFVKSKFFTRLKAIATCDNGGGCQSADQDRMTFVDDHQAQFENHGFCAQASSDPAFDQACFLKNGNSFKIGQSDAAAADPMACPRLLANAFHAYDSRQRWIRTANDSYFAAMTYPDGDAKILQPTYIHDALWGLMSAVYGGAMHPTAQGYAAMADAALPAARRLLGLPTPP